jgi:membrane-associated phospholipid phosphatase
VWVFPVILIVCAALLLGARGPRHRGPPLLAGTAAHARAHYRRRNLLRWVVVSAGAAVLAHSGADERIERWHTERVRSRSTDALAERLHFFGERFWVLGWALVALIDARWRTTAFTRFGRRSFEALCIGLPSLWITQRVLGAARPRDLTHGPRYLPFADDNTASGHTFMAAIPLLTLARRTGTPAIKTVAYALSPLTGWSRLNDRAHYPSQVLLGYALAWAAVDTVAEERDGGAAPAGDAPNDGVA